MSQLENKLRLMGYESRRRSSFPTPTAPAAWPPDRSCSYPGTGAICRRCPRSSTRASSAVT